jgi:hypothetical protein
VQTDTVVEENVTTRPEDAVALSAKGLAPRVWSARLANAMLWLAEATAKVWLTGAAAA